MKVPHRPTRSLQVKILGAPALFGVLCLIFAAIVLREAVSRQLEQQIQRRAEGLTEVVQQAADVLGESSEFTRIVNSLDGSRDVKLIVVTAGQPPHVIAATRNSWAGLPADAIVAPDVGGRELTELDRSTFGHHHHPEREQLGFAAPISMTLRGARHPVHGVVLVHLDTADLDRELSRSTTIILSVTGTTMLVLLGATLGILRRFILAPIRKIDHVINLRAT